MIKKFKKENIIPPDFNISGDKNGLEALDKMREVIVNNIRILHDVYKIPLIRISREVGVSYTLIYDLHKGCYKSPIKIETATPLMAKLNYITNYYKTRKKND